MPTPLPVGELFGYARVSTEDQNLDMQIEALTRAGVKPHRLHTDRKSGKNLKRPGVQDMLDLMRPGDVVIVWKIDRLGRSVRDLVFLMEHFEQRGIQVRSVTEGIDTTNAMGRMFFQLMAVMAELERALISERSKTGMAVAKAKRGQKFGRARILTDRQIDAAITWLKPRKAQRGAVQIIAKQLKVSPYTLRDRVLERVGKRLWPKGPRARD
jgi:DNA invertase Pin-like site-specific DNA recombinase